MKKYTSEELSRVTSLDELPGPAKTGAKPLIRYKVVPLSNGEEAIVVSRYWWPLVVIKGPRLKWEFLRWGL